MGAFRLSKWYLDCVGDDGTVLLGYSALLQWGLVRVPYSTATICLPDGRSETRRQLSGPPHPVRDGQATTWRSKTLGIEATWTALSRPTKATLLDTPEGAVRWECVAPVARAEASFGNRRLAGFGYVERLEMTIPPWRLPIRELRWGRFSAGSEWLVWIDWRGEMPMTLVLVGGEEVPGARVGDESVELGERGVLHLGSPRVLRRGTLMSTALSGMPALTAMLPRGILETEECKWLSRGRLESPKRADGWALHELVRFSNARPAISG